MPAFSCLEPFSIPLKILKNPIKYKTLIKGSVLAKGKFLGYLQNENLLTKIRAGCANVCCMKHRCSWRLRLSYWINALINCCQTSAYAILIIMSLKELCNEYNTPTFPPTYFVIPVQFSYLLSLPSHYFHYSLKTIKYWCRTKNANNSKSTS